MLPTLTDDSVQCVIVCAGMDGALPSVVAGLIKSPVVAVPTSIGYGASFNGGERAKRANEVREMTAHYLTLLTVSCASLRSALRSALRSVQLQHS